jgi:hypothetical protein
LIIDLESKLEVRNDLSRQLVSAQLHAQAPFYRWFRFREGFSPKLVEKILAVAGTPSSMLDPFAGGGTAMFEASNLGWHAEGIELLPVGNFVIDARQAGHICPKSAFAGFLHDAVGRDWDEEYDEKFRFPHVRITEHAFPEETERQLAGYRAYISRFVGNLKALAEFAAFSILEEISYTRKDGQYLRWDKRAGKTAKSTFNKGEISAFDEALRRKLDMMAFDIQTRQQEGRVRIRTGSCLEVMPTIASGSVGAIVTSPPYCNRYDYTRTYALELAYLHCGADRIKELRQALLSCTVENRSKRDILRHISREAYDAAAAAHDEQPDLQAIYSNLDAASLNNPGIPRMVRGYFLEMAFVIHEMFRTLKRGCLAAMVNDNVRYGGIEVPVDLLLSDLASRLGFKVERIWVLPRGKGNSSQQMSTYGRAELRKSICLWRKP